MEFDPDKIEKLTLKEAVEEVLQEARMVLPGVQALFGFQLIAFFNSTYADLSATSKLLHLIAVGLTIISIGLLMAPAAYHRQVERQTVSKNLVCYATSLITIGMAPLAASISLEVYVVTRLALNNSTVSIIAALSAAIFLAIFWYFLPQYFKRSREKAINTAEAISG